MRRLPVRLRVEFVKPCLSFSTRRRPAPRNPPCGGGRVDPVRPWRGHGPPSSDRGAVCDQSAADADLVDDSLFLPSEEGVSDSDLESDLEAPSDEEAELSFASRDRLRVP